MNARFFLLVGLVVSILVACTATGESMDIEADVPGNGGGGSSVRRDSTESGEPLGEYTLSEYIEMVDIPATTVIRSNVEYSVSAYSISWTEVTQGLYNEIMGDVLKEDYLGDDYPVFNVSWYDAVLFCNALSKKVGLDTAYVYKPNSRTGAMENLSVRYNIATVRLPTEMEWEVAARAGTTTTYYWGTNTASRYAYYGQDKGPATVASFFPNAFGLYDMAGNVAEWVNDWYTTYPTVSQGNYTGPVDGTYKSVRGGGWSDNVKALASAERAKKLPEYRSQMLGFRIVYSVGF